MAFGLCNVEVDGQLYSANVNGEDGLLNFINSHQYLSSILGMSFDVESDRYKISNKDSQPHRIRLIWIDKQGHSQGGIGSIDGYFDNPTMHGEVAGSIWMDCFCLEAALPVILTIDDNGLRPINGIYSGTISPPTPGLHLNFNIQWYKLDNSMNGRVTSINNDAGLYLNEDGSRWFVDLNNLANWADRPGPNSFSADGKYVITINNTARREYIVDSTANCTPTVLPMLNTIIPAADNYYYSFRINGGEIVTETTSCGEGYTAQQVFVNVLSYQWRHVLSTYFCNGTPAQTAFLAKYDQPIRGGSVNTPNFIRAEVNTVEFLLTQGAEHDLIQTIFGGSVALHSCAIINWT